MALLKLKHLNLFVRNFRLKISVKQTQYVFGHFHSVAYIVRENEKLGSNFGCVRNRFLHQNCWKCGKVSNANSFQCGHCGVIQKLASEINYFAVFGIEQSFNVNVSLLAKKFREVQYQYHPDKFVNKKDEQQLSEDLSSFINKAYKTLLNPVLRGIYMLKLHSTEFPENTQSKDLEFLSLIMDLNMELEGASDLDKLSPIKLLVDSEYKKLLEVISKDFEGENYEQARNDLVKLKYFENLKQTLSDKEFNFQNKNS